MDDLAHDAEAAVDQEEKRWNWKEWGVRVYLCGWSVGPTFWNDGIACRDAASEGVELTAAPLVRPIHRRNPDTGADGPTRGEESIISFVGLTC